MLTAELLHRFKEQPVIIVMGVSGCGKSSVGKALAKKIGKRFFDADDYHSQANIDKMSNGIALTDNDRLPWLINLGRAIAQELTENGGVVCGCSALKKKYRDILRNEIKSTTLFVLLDGTKEILQKRISKRSDHYMPVSLLESQLRDLEKPSCEEIAITVSIDNKLNQIVDEITSTLKLEEK